jgi:hypothetical protein
VRDDEPVCLCESGYHAEGADCVADPEGCGTASCSGHGECDDSSGEVVCACEDGYAGARCEECESGYHREGGPSGGLGECVPDVDPCAPDPCDGADCGHGSCACVGGEAICSCEPGWDGDACDECDEDYELVGDECLPCNQVLFSFERAGALSVWLTGDWTGWADSLAGGAIEMTAVGANVWQVRTPIETGGQHEYKYIVNGTEWVWDETAPTVGEGVFTNNVVEVCDFGGGGGSCGDVATPDWRDVVMYFVMVDRFRDSDGSASPVDGASDGPDNGPSGQYEGGDLAGVTERMGYLDELGVTAIWLSAPYDNRDSAGAAINPAEDTHLYSGYHGYWPSPANVDYADPTDPRPRPLVESRIGDEGDLRALIGSAHDTPGATGEGIRVLFDYVMNHVDSESGLYAAHGDWFARDGGRFRLCGPENLWDDAYWGTRCAFTDYLPPFDFYNEEARAWSVADAMWWAIEYGIDGYRLDAIKHVPLSWLEDLRTALNERVADPWGERFYLVGETFAYDDAGLIRSFVDPDTMLDGQFDFPFKARVCEAVFTEGGGLNHLDRQPRHPAGDPLRQPPDRQLPGGELPGQRLERHGLRAACRRAALRAPRGSLRDHDDQPGHSADLLRGRDRARRRRRSGQPPPDGLG